VVLIKIGSERARIRLATHPFTLSVVHARVVLTHWLMAVLGRIWNENVAWPELGSTRQSELTGLLPTFIGTLVPPVPVPVLSLTCRVFEDVEIRRE